MNAIRAKFYVGTVVKDAGQEIVNLFAVIAGSEDTDENKSFSNATPCGHLEMTVSNPDAQGFFKQGSEYYLDFTEAAK